MNQTKLAQETAFAAIRANVRDQQLEEARADTQTALEALRDAEIQRTWHSGRLADSRARVGQAFDKFDQAAEGVRSSLQSLSETTMDDRQTIEHATASVVKQFEVLAESLADMARKKIKDAAEHARETLQAESDDARSLLISEREMDARSEPGSYPPPRRIDRSSQPVDC